jgi:hypothetical protein
MEEDAAGIWAQRPGEDVQQRCLARAVWADDANRLTLIQPESDTVQNHERAETLAHIDRGEDRGRHGQLPV